jgi:hypothetical protein
MVCIMRKDNKKYWKSLRNPGDQKRKWAKEWSEGKRENSSNDSKTNVCKMKPHSIQAFALTGPGALL